MYTLDILLVTLSLLLLVCILLVLRPPQLLLLYTLRSIILLLLDSMHTQFELQPPRTDLLCFELNYNDPYDPEAIWSLVQRHSGYVEPGHGGQYHFYIHRDYSSLVYLAWPGLKRRPSRDFYL